MNKLLLPVFVAIVASVTAVTAIAQEVKGDAQAGEKKISLCIGCHGIVGYQASFPEVHKVPKISGQSAKYIASALGAYKKGERKHPTMRGIADSLSEQDIADVAAYYEASGVKTAAPVVSAENATKVPDLVTKGGCASCHGEGLSKPIDPTYPKIAGQHSDYLFVALKAYKTENNPMVGRGNAIMGSIAKQFSNAELKELAAYVGSLSGELQTVPQSKFK
ncbi:MAG: cytochrome c4 [Burkholderiales bacterium]|nr:cytochrome c4 [Burkholderiales bacterium]